ncbi:hypothetical protein AAA799O18_00035 [Marine Group I thaumarchaeote SCGC AAA799-O18]|nr:hypothetical protein AAA799O18_00035 [Marine Group I thaumarchaeote SCGC AAA799-O18]
MEFLHESVLNLVGLAVGIIIGCISYFGFKNTGSPTLFRLSIAFIAIGIGFGILAFGYILDDSVTQTGKINRGITTLGVASQAVGYWFIAFSHTIKTFFPKSRYLRSVGIMPLFLVSFVSVEHILRAVSFILLVYGSIETMISYLNGKKKTTLFVAVGLALLGFGEFVSWYSFVFPETILYVGSIIIKICGLFSLGIPIFKIPLRKITFDENM